MSCRGRDPARSHLPLTKNFRVSIAVSVASMMYPSILPALEYRFAFLPEGGDALPEIVGLETGLLRHGLAVERFGQGMRFPIRKRSFDSRDCQRGAGPQAAHHSSTTASSSLTGTTQ